MNSYKAQTSYFANVNSIVAQFKVSDLVKDSALSASSAWINNGGWQSWNPGFEIKPGEKQLSLHCRMIKPFNRYLEVPGSKFTESKNLVLGQFVIYLRWDDYYLCLASTGNIKNQLPPVQFVINRKNNTIDVELCDIGKNWAKDELQCQLEIFTAESYFELREKLQKIFGSSDKASADYTTRFDQIQFLGKTAAGWESWYNHYSKIDEKLILEDLESLSTTKNVLNQGNFNNIVFQIDDGWEKGLGDWEIREDRFPNGLASITEKINAKGYVPGLWLAPFIIDLRTPIAKQHPEWIMKDETGKPIPAGFNPLWGDKFGKNQPGFPGSFYALDISIPEVITYLDKVIERAIEDWGFRYLKLDFLYGAMINGQRKNPGASYEYYAKAVAFLTRRHTNSKGQEVTYLGCGAPLELSFKDFPLCRIGCDTFENWENNLSKKLRINGRNSAYLNLKDTIGRALWDKIIYANDPDVIFVRNENCTLNRKQKLLIAYVAAMFGSQIMYSDDPATSNSEEEIALAKEIADIFKKFENEEFSVKNTGKDLFEVASKSGKYKGVLNLEDGYADIQ